MSESAALRHVDEAEKAAAAVDGLSPDTPTKPIRSAGVVGFGTMGSGIAMAFANAGIPVQVLDETREALDKGLAGVRRAYQASREKLRITSEEYTARLGRIHATLDYADLARADVVVEAVFEEMAAKQRVFARLDGVCREDAILATNTSSLNVALLAHGTKRPERVVGMHFFSPAHVMRLVEVVRPRSVSPETLATTLELVRTLGKTGVVVGICDGFVGNRMLYAYRRQTDFLLEDGALPAQVDKALTDFGLPMGPYQMADLAGLDISWRIRKRQAAMRDPALRYCPIADRLCEAGRFGQKTGAGWYRYEPGSRTPVPDPVVEETIRAVSAEKGIARREIRDEEIVERALFALVNEGARLLEEGIAARPGDIDVIWIHGYGFPRARGGPMFWADSVGLFRVAEVVNALHAEQGDLVRPSRKLLTLARDGGRLSEV
jgi:3-hydroxyacyl-CoA dehydrogenase